MDVYDSSVWLFGLTGSCAEATNLLEEVVHGDRNISVDAYIYNEVLEGIRRAGMSGRTIDEMQQRFAELVYQEDGIRDTPREAIERMDLEEVRNATETGMLSDSWGIQRKDVPIVSAAYRIRGDHPTIFTSDRDFSEFNPAEYGVPEIDMEYVDCP